MLVKFYVSNISWPMASYFFTPWFLDSVTLFRRSTIAVGWGGWGVGGGVMSVLSISFQSLQFQITRVHLSIVGMDGFKLNVNTHFIIFID